MPDIEILQTNDDCGFHAYCFKGVDWVKCRMILAATPEIDPHFLMAGIGRGYFTLRYSDIKGKEFKHVLTLPGYSNADLTYKDVSCFVEYTKAVL